MFPHCVNNLLTRSLVSCACSWLLMKDLWGYCNCTPSSTWKRKSTPLHSVFSYILWPIRWQSHACFGVRAGGASKIMEFARSAPQTVQRSSVFNILNHLSLNFSICLWKLQTWVRHDNLAQGCCLYLSKRQSVLPFFFLHVSNFPHCILTSEPAPS